MTPRVSWLALTLVLAGCASGWSARDQREHDWVDAQFPRALDWLLPLDEKAPLSCRAYRDFWVESPEFLINVLDVEDDAGREVELVQPVGRSIWEQLRIGHRRKPDATFEEVISEVRLRTERFGAGECAELADLEMLDAEEVETAPQPNSITIHPWVRRCLSSRGEVITITDPLHGASVWLSSVYEALQACRRSNGRPPDRP